MCEGVQTEGPTDRFLAEVLILRHNLTTDCSTVMIYDGARAIIFYELHRWDTQLYVRQVMAEWQWVCRAACRCMSLTTTFVKPVSVAGRQMNSKVS